MILDEDGEPVSLALSTEIRCHVFVQGTTVEVMDSTEVTIVDSTAGEISVAPDSSHVSSTGYYDLEIEVTWSDGTVSSWPNYGFEELTIGRQLK